MLGPGRVTDVSRAAHIGWITDRGRSPNYVGGAEFGGILPGFISRRFHSCGCCEGAPRSLDLADKFAAGDGGFIGVCDFRGPVESIVAQPASSAIRVIDAIDRLQSGDSTRHR